jgi:hypothetical protein
MATRFLDRPERFVTQDSHVEPRDLGLRLQDIDMQCRGPIRRFNLVDDPIESNVRVFAIKRMLFGPPRLALYSRTTRIPLAESSTLISRFAASYP